jgi:hypothetical protein
MCVYLIGSRTTKDLRRDHDHLVYSTDVRVSYRQEAVQRSEHKSKLSLSTDLSQSGCDLSINRLTVLDSRKLADELLT